MIIKKYLFQVVLLCNFTLIVFSQDSNIVVAEGSEAVICGHIVIVDALWYYEGTIKADISILEKQNSKPITGGYKKGDEITISSEPGCTYYVYSITKTGGIKSKGEVTLSKSPPVSGIDVKKDIITQEEHSSYEIGKYDWYVESIRNESGKTIANITITKNTALIENLVLSIGDLVWLGDKLYKVEVIQNRSKFIKTDPEKIYEPLPGKIEFKAVMEYINKK
ncbi:MAG TPA: hypothetical protein PKE39_07690 [Ignavibacteria bacterium]|nr:hypothetical protein [Ignavibacteria bacterium]HMQ98893.1 hypothetical protein [Ignavibacteria bacterium]